MDLFENFREFYEKDSPQWVKDNPLFALIIGVATVIGFAYFLGFRI